MPPGARNESIGIRLLVFVVVQDLSCRRHVRLVGLRDVDLLRDHLGQSYVLSLQALARGRELLDQRVAGLSSACSRGFH